MVSWEKDGITWEPDPRHAELIISQLGLDDAKPLKLPGVKEESRRSQDEEKALEEEVAAVHRMVEFGEGTAETKRKEGRGERRAAVGGGKSPSSGPNSWSSSSRAG